MDNIKVRIAPDFNSNFALLLLLFFSTVQLSAQVIVSPNDNGEVKEGEGHRQFWQKLEEAIVEKNALYSTSKTHRAFIRTKEANKKLAAATNSAQTVTGVWGQVFQANSDQQGGGMGRIDDVAFEPGNANVYYIATAGGGLWKTTNNGASFFNVTGSLPASGGNSVIISHANANIVYFFSGRGLSNQASFSGGVYKSTDGGVSWAPTGLFDKVDGTTPLEGYELKMHPTNANIIFAATNQGLFRTQDAGYSWTKVITSPVFDVEFKPNNSSIVYAAQQRNVLTSTTGGDSASFIGGNSLFGNNYPTSVNGFGWMRMAVTPASPDRVFVASSVGSINDSVYAADGGTFLVKYTYNSNSETLDISSFPAKIEACNQRMFRSGGGRPYSDIYVSQANSLNIIIMGLEAMATSNGGISYVMKSLGCSDGIRRVHVDAGKIRENSGNIYLSTDGGLYRQTENYTTSTAAWTDVTGGLEITQSYVHDATPQDANMYMLANQDNGTHLRTATGYNLFVGGDGTTCAINPNDKNIYYGSVQNGAFFTRYDNGVYTGIRPGPGCNCPDTSEYAGSFVWGRAFMQEPANPNYLVAAKTRLYTSLNKGSTWTTKVITGSTTTHYIARVSTTNNGNTIYVVEDGSLRFLRSINYGNDWTNLTVNKRFGGIISDIAISPTNHFDIYMSYLGNVDTAKLYRSIDGGASWINLSAGLPNVDIRTIALAGDAENGVYVGTDIGVYYRNNSLGRWIDFSNSLPIVFVMNLKYDAVNQKISAATWGRGIWVSDAYNAASCQPSLALNSTYSGRRIFAASGQITSTGNIEGDANSRIVFSGNDVIMSPGFRAIENSSFRAVPEGCAPSTTITNAASPEANVVKDSLLPGALKFKTKVNTSSKNTPVKNADEPPKITTGIIKRKD
ncbi:MAG: 3-coathanger stack domain-containing protein [Bacteroidota bacterium]